MNAANGADLCCGQDGSWSPKPGSPVSPACMLCKQSPTYWRRNHPKAHLRVPPSNGIDPAALSARLAAIAADPDWPNDLRAEAQTAATEGLDVDTITDSVIITALNARIVARTRQPHAAPNPDITGAQPRP